MFVWKGSLAMAVVAASAFITAMAGSAQAATYYLQANQPSNGWEWLDDWWDQPSGGGNHPTTYNDNSFDTQGYQVKAGAGVLGNSGTTAILGANQASSKGLIVRASVSSSPTAVANLEARGGEVLSGVNPSTPVYLTVANFINTSGIILQGGDNGDARTLFLNITASLTGSGNFTLQTSGAAANAAGGTIHLTANGASGYTGDITFGDTASRYAILDFDNNLISGGGLVLNANSKVALDQNVTFHDVTINGTPLTPGTYAFAALNSAYDSIFVDGGSGSITVVPEPASLALLGLAGLMAGPRRRRH